MPTAYKKESVGTIFFYVGTYHHTTYIYVDRRPNNEWMYVEKASVHNYKYAESALKIACLLCFIFGFLLPAGYEIEV